MSSFAGSGRLALLALLLALAVHAQAQACGNVTLFKAGHAADPYIDDASPSFRDGHDRVCARMFIDTTNSAFACLNITIKAIRLCAGTDQDLLLFDPLDPGSTGCHTPVTTGIVRTNVLYDSQNPGSMLSVYNPNVEIITGELMGNLGEFCFDVKKLTNRHNYILEIDWHYLASWSTAPCGVFAPPGVIFARSSGADEGTGTCGGVYHVDCKKRGDYKFVPLVGCVQKQGDDDALPIVLGSLALFFALIGLVLLFVLRRGATPSVTNKINQDIFIDLVQGPDGALSIAEEATRSLRYSTKQH